MGEQPNWVAFEEPDQAGAAAERLPYVVSCSGRTLLKRRQTEREKYFTDRIDECLLEDLRKAEVNAFFWLFPQRDCDGD